METRKRFAVIVLLCLFVGGGFFSSAAESVAAEKFPSREIIIINSLAAGSGNDLATRVLAESLKTSVGVPVVVENRPEANGIKAVMDVYKARPDGYTLLSQTLPRNVQMEIVYKTAYKSLEFTYLPAYQRMDMILAVNINSPHKSLKALFDASRKKSMNCSIAGMGSRGHLVAMSLKKAGFNFEVVPYKGGSQALTALVGGHVDLALADDIAVLQQKERLRFLALFYDERSAIFPGVPTFKESGFELPNIYSMLGICAPPRLPEETRKVLEGALTKAIKSVEFTKGLEKLGGVPIYKSGPEFHAVAQAHYKVVEEYKDILQEK